MYDCCKDESAAAKEKAALRKEMKARRRAVPAEERIRAGESVCRKLASLGEPPGGLATAIYLATSNEIDIDGYARELLARGAAVAAPKWNGSSYDLVRLRSLEEGDLAAGPMGVREPAAGETVDPREVGRWIVPGLAFSEDGARMGYGGGWYDRLLENAKGDAEIIGIAYRFQVLPGLPVEPHDARMTGIVQP